MNEIHEPQTVKDAKNAAAYFLVLGIVTCGLLFVIGGMISPYFQPKIYRHLDASFKNDVLFKNSIPTYKFVATILVFLWFFGSWALMIYLNLHPSS